MAHFYLVHKINIIMDSEAVKCSCKSLVRDLKQSLWKPQKTPWNLYGVGSWVCKPQIFVKLFCVTGQKIFVWTKSVVCCTRISSLLMWFAILCLKLYSGEAYLKNKSWKQNSINIKTASVLLWTLSKMKLFLTREMSG